MTDLADRLQRLLGTAAAPQPRAAPGPRIDQAVDGVWRENAEGRCFVAQARYALDYRHGDLSLREALEQGPRLLQAAGLPHVDMERLLFIDTETTGLGRDVGTVAFLVGVGGFEGDWFTVRQYFMGDHDDELALLAELEQELARRDTLVTFNGTTFDWPLLENRYLYNALPAPAIQGHLDLLRWSRSLWRNVLPSCALSALEPAMLGVRRAQEDVPGYLIPQLYYDYLRTGNAAPLAGVFYHNLMDVVSMASLLTRVAATINTPAERAPELDDPVAVGRLHERLGRIGEALAVYAAAAACGDAQRAAQAHDHQGLLLKRLGRFEEAAAVWAMQLEGPSPTPTIELAKHLEHRQRDYAAAREVVQHGLLLVQAGQIEHPWPDDLLQDLTHRLGRLERRLARAVGRAQADQEST
jgi:hypothetical protein